MPINFTDYANIAPQAAPDLFGGLIEAYKKGKKFREESEAAEAQKKLVGLKMQYAPREMEAGIGLKEAQAEQARKYGGLQYLSGVAKESAALESLRTELGDNSPVYQRAKDAFQLEQDRSRSTLKYNNFLMDHPERYLSSVSKGLVEQNEASQGRLLGVPGGLTPEQSEEIVNVHERDRFNKTNPDFLKQRALASAQIDKTLELINPKDAFVYSGVNGATELAKDRVAAQTSGHPSEKLLKFEEQITHLKFLRGQIRAYNKDSISPSNLEDLDYVINPSNWVNHPETAERKFGAVVKTYENERHAVTAALKGGNPYGAKPLFPAPNSPGSERIAQEKSKGGPSTALVTIDVDGRKASVPANKVDAFMMKYPNGRIING